jgi:hypothetical protein
VRGEGREPLPERAHALGAGHGGAAVRDASVRPRAVELQPRLDDVDGLQAARLHDAAQGPRRRLDVRRDGGAAASASASASAALLGRGSRPGRRCCGRRRRRLRQGGGGGCRGHSGSGGGLTGFGWRGEADRALLSTAKDPESSGAGYIGIGARLRDASASPLPLVRSATCVTVQGPGRGPTCEWRGVVRAGCRLQTARTGSAPNVLQRVRCSDL